MKKLCTLLLAAVAISAQAQNALITGFGSMGAINATTYAKTSPVGTGGYYSVSSSRDGQRFYASRNNGTLYYINASTYAYTDSISIQFNDIASANETDRLFALRDSFLFRLNTTTKSVDSIVVGKELFKLEERPGTKEIWISGTNKIYIADYTSSLVVTNTISAGAGQFDYGEIRFTKGGSLAYKLASNVNRLYRINANSKTVTDSVATPYTGVTGIEVSTDSSKVFVSSPNLQRIYIHNATTLALIDSIVTTRETFFLYRHPSRGEIWAINHFDDSVTVYNDATNAQIAAFDGAPSNHVIAFATGTTSIQNAITKAPGYKIYPNPATTELHIDFGKSEQHNVSVYNTAGVKTAAYAASSASFTLDITALPAGTYFIIVHSNDGNSTNTFIKQ